MNCCFLNLLKLKFSTEPPPLERCCGKARGTHTGDEELGQGR